MSELLEKARALRVRKSAVYSPDGKFDAFKVVTALTGLPVESVIRVQCGIKIARLRAILVASNALSLCALALIDLDPKEALKHALKIDFRQAEAADFESAEDSVIDLINYIELLIEWHSQA